MNVFSHYKKFKKLYHIRREKPQLWHFPEQGFGYIQIPKVATRSIREGLLNSPGLSSGKDIPLPEFEEKNSLHIHQDKIRPLVKSLLLFAFVRHPLARLYSAYTNKIADAGNANRRNIFECHGIHFGISFPEFLEKVCAIPDNKIDRHLRSQSWFLCDSKGNLIPDFIGHLETFDKDWLSLCAKIPSLGPVPHKNKSAHGQDYRSKYTPETEQLARTRYARDFERFGYE